MIIKGNGQPERQADDREWVSGQGWVTTEVWEGTKGAILGMAQQLALTPGYSRVRAFSSDNVKWRINATVGGFDGGGGETEPEELWELMGLVLQEDVARHPKYQALTALQKSTIREHIQDPSLQSTAPSNLTGDFAHFYNLMTQGQNAYNRGYWSLRHTSTLGSYADLNVSMAGVDKIWPVASIPAASAPNAFRAAVANVAATFTAPSGYTWGWLKQPPEISQTVGGRIQAITEWWFYCWSNVLYDEYTG